MTNNYKGNFLIKRVNLFPVELQRGGVNICHLLWCISVFVYNTTFLLNLYNSIMTLYNTIHVQAASDPVNNQTLTIPFLYWNPAAGK